MLVKIPEAKLLKQALGETLLHGESVVLGTFVLSVIIDPKLVCRDVVITALQFIDGNILRFIVILAFRVSAVVKHGIVVKLSLNALFQLLDRQFNEFDGLDLKRRQFLSLLQF